MYPTISDLIKDLFGVNIPLPVQSFGFMMAISFLLAAILLQMELKRKEKLGLMLPVTVKVMRGLPASPFDLLSSFLIGFLLGFKLVYVIFNYSHFVNDTQGVLLSRIGNLPAGIIFGVISAYMRYREKEKEKLTPPVEVDEIVHPYQLIGNITMIAAVAGILGAKIFHNLENLDDFRRDPIDALLSFSGLTMYGGLILAAISVIWYGKKYGLKPLILSDAAAPSLMLSYGTGRIGCHIAGDGDWGIVNLNPKPDWLSWMPDWCWAYNYPNNVINEGIPIPGCEGKHCMMLPDAVFPTAFYEAVACILLFLFIWNFRKKITTPGKIFALYLLLNGIERLFIEQIRVNNKFEFLTLQITQAEFIASIFILLGAAGLIFLKPEKTTSL
ncbi:hypothetical protein BH11BAC2_BH11BAC2_18600 [soil metagenome]